MLAEDEEEIEIRELDDDIEGTARELGLDIGNRSGQAASDEMAPSRREIDSLDDDNGEDQPDGEDD